LDVWPPGAGTFGAGELPEPFGAGLLGLVEAGAELLLEVAGAALLARAGALASAALTGAPGRSSEACSGVRARKGEAVKRMVDNMILLSVGMIRAL
jgi:hypothetical protein